MFTRKRILAVVSIAGIVAVLTWWADSTREPKYQGRALSFWLEELQSRDESRRQQAKTAIHEMGPAAVSPLIDRLRYHSSFWRRQLERLSARQKFFHIAVIDDDAYANLAKDGFWAAGTNAIVGLPELTRMLNERADCDRAGVVLPYLGVAAIPALTNAFASRDAHVRAAAVRWLAINQSLSFANRLVPVVLPLLKDPSPEVRGGAAQSLGGLAVQPEIVVPAITNLLSETNDYVLTATCWGLTHFRTNALIAVPLLLPLCNHPSQSVRDYAKGAVRAISPEAADKAGIK